MLFFQNVCLINLRHLLTMVEQLLRHIVNSRSLLRHFVLQNFSIDPYHPRLDHHKDTRPFSFFLTGFYNLLPSKVGPPQTRSLRTFSQMGCGTRGVRRNILTRHSYKFTGPSGLRGRILPCNTPSFGARSTPLRRNQRRERMDPACWWIQQRQRSWSGNSAYLADREHGLKGREMQLQSNQQRKRVRGSNRRTNSRPPNGGRKHALMNNPNDNYHNSAIYSWG